MTRMQIITLDVGWNSIQQGINKLIQLLEGGLEEQFNAEQYMHLYTIIFNMCIQKAPHDYSEQLYTKYKEVCTTYIQERLLPLLRDHQHEMLFNQGWKNYKIMVRWLSRSFSYLDRYYVRRHSLPNLKDVGLMPFRDLVYVEIKRKAKDDLLRMIEKEREGELVDRALIKNILSMFIDVGNGGMESYDFDFEEDLLTDTNAYYKRKASTWIEQDSCPVYMRKAEEAIRSEEERAETCLPASTKVKLLKDIETEVLVNNQAAILTNELSGFAALLRDDKTDDLARMYRLFHRISKGLDPVAEQFKQHVESEYNKLVREVTEEIESKRDREAGQVVTKDIGSPTEQQFVRSIVDLHDKYLGFVSTCFNNDPLFHNLHKEAFEAFCNKNVANSSSAELMASFCDNLLKKGGTEKLTDEAVEETLDKVVKLLAFINDKDLFVGFYRKKLARRLLHDKSSSDDHERYILSRLKQQCGAQFTFKMEGMVTDWRLSREKQAAFNEWMTRGSKNLSIDMSVTVLSTGFWPTYKATELALPKEMVDGVDLFKSFYEVDNKHRRLSWIYSLGSCNIKGSFDAKPIELQMTTMQAVVCLLFNDAAELTYDEIKDRTNLQDEDVVRLLHSLSCAKYKLLLKDPVSKTISKTDTFKFNNKFTDRMRRIKIPLPPVDERRKVIEDVDKERKYTIEAAIVRTMKSRKVLQHQQLVMEVVQQLSRMFKPDLKLVKKHVEDLVTREYLVRDPDNPQQFKYVA